MKRIMIIAGESSGDLHGAGVVREIRRRNPDVEVFGIGGDRMQAEGMQLIYHVREMSFMGFIEVVKHLPLIRSVETTLRQLLRLKIPDAVLLIDYPGFNLRFARSVKERGIPVVYYISPQVWAWKKGRLKKMRAVIDRMLCVFPFEVPLYEKANIPVQFVGHPLVEEIADTTSKEHFCKRYTLDPKKEIIGLIPGSRKQEIDNLFSVMARSAQQIAAERSMEIVVAVAPHLEEEYLRTKLPPGARVTFVRNETHNVMKHSALALVTSGTATLETALLGTPMIVMYRTSWFTYLIARLVVQIEWISLVNIVAGKSLVPELIQHHVHVENVVSHMNRLLNDRNALQTMKEGLVSLKEKLGNAGASKNVAEAILSIGTR